MAEDYSYLSAEFTTLQGGELVRAGEDTGLVAAVGRDSSAGISLATVTIRWQILDENGAPLDYEETLYEVPDMHHYSLPHLEVWRDRQWQSVANLDFYAMRAVEEEAE